MTKTTDKTILTTSMELLQGQAPLFLIHSNRIASDNHKKGCLLGNHKHGSLDAGHVFNKDAISEGPVAKLFEISCLEVDEHFDLWPDSLSFYGYYGRFNANEIAMLRPFKFPRHTGYLRLTDLFGKHTIIAFDSRLRRWARSKFSKLETVANVLNDVLVLKLLDHSYLSFHAASLEIDGKAILLAGLPNTGKTYSTIQLLPRGANFMSEDVTIVSEDRQSIAQPFTATMEKRLKVSLLERIRAGIFQSIYKQNFAKETFLDTPYWNKKNICVQAPIAAIFFLSRGEPNCCLAEKEQICQKLLSLQHLEFSYSRNMAILSYLFFNNATIEDYIVKESKLIRNLVEHVPVYEVSAPGHTEFVPLIEKAMSGI